VKQGIVVSNKANLYEVEYENAVYTCLARGKLKQDRQVVVGDFVTLGQIEPEKKEAVIESVQERTTFLKRPKVANLTQIVFVVSMKMPKPDCLLLDKQLAYAEWLGIHPIICLNKTDLVKREQVEEIRGVYEKIGYTVIEAVANKKQGTEVLRGLLKGNITALSGNSGVGKSTFINALLGKDITTEGDISAKKQKGKNTTTHIQLYKLEEETYLADTPGFATFSVEEMESANLWKYFREFPQYVANCEYIGCSHRKEEPCGVKEAVREGNICESRYQHYKRIYEEIKQKEERRW